VGGITLAWLLGEGIIIWRSVNKNHRPPMPGELLGSSGFFALCALLAEYPPARTTATLLAFGIDLAAYLQAPLVTTKAPTTTKAPAASNTPTGA
jgi:hypothetical protein